MKTIWRVAGYLFRYKAMFWGTLALALGSTFFFMLVPQITRYILDDIIATRNLDKLAAGLWMLVGCFLLRELLDSLRIRLNNTLEQRVLIDLRRDLHAKLLTLPVRFFDHRKSGDIATVVTEDVQSVERVLLDGTEQGSKAIVMILAAAGIMFYTQPLLATLIVLPIPVIYALSRAHFNAQSRNWRFVRDSASDLNALLVEDIQGNRLINSFSLGQREGERFDTLAQTLRRHTLKAMYRWSIQGPTTNFIFSMSMVATVGYGGYLLGTRPDFSTGTFLMFFQYGFMLYMPLADLNGLNNMFATGKASGERVFEMLDHPIDVADPQPAKPFPAAPLEVRYEHVDFNYAGRAELLADFSLTLPAGKVTALVGHTGAGKSTVANLLQRYYDVTAGSVSINGIDVRDLGLDALRSSIGVVAQDPFLFSGTIRDNLLLAKEDATETELIRALEGASAWEYVSQLPQGMDTMIGERGIRLSMGEKQRLTIARVILRNPPLVVLDEATSSVDTLTEAKIQQAIDNLVKERTTLVIAHRLSTVRKADQIVVLEQGRIVERGAHADLIRSRGHYADLWRAQTDMIPENA